MVVKRLSAVRIPPFGPRLYLTLDTLCYSRRDVLLHDLFIVDGIANVDIGGVRHVRHSRVQVENIWWSVL